MLAKKKSNDAIILVRSWLPLKDGVIFQNISQRSEQVTNHEYITFGLQSAALLAFARSQDNGHPTHECNPICSSVSEGSITAPVNDELFCPDWKINTSFLII